MCGCKLPFATILVHTERHLTKTKPKYNAVFRLLKLLFFPARLFSALRTSWLWCILMYFDVSWHILMYLDVSWCILTSLDYLDVSWYISMYLDYLDVSWRILMYLDVSWCTQVQHKDTCDTVVDLINFKESTGIIYCEDIKLIIYLMFFRHIFYIRSKF